MKNLLLVVVSFIAISLGATVAVLLQQPDISTLEIDRDRAAVAAEIAAARLEDEKYAGGLIKAFLGVRISILQNTLAMLDQKRASLIRRIALNYTLEGKSIKPASDDELNVILEELTQAEKKSAQSRSEASQYSGGLLQSMKLIKLETDEISVSQLRLKFYSAKHGIPMPIPALAPATDSPEKPVGKVVKDREAL